MIKMKIIDALIILLNSNNKEIVYYSLGALINLSNSEEIKGFYGSGIIEAMVSIINDCGVDESEILLLSLKVFFIINF
jgi:hypothetical protein